MKINLIVLYSCTIIIFACDSKSEGDAGTMEKNQALAFSESQIIDSASYWWALTIADVTGDNLSDIVFIDNNSAGGYLGYYSGQEEPGIWTLSKIAEVPRTGGTFAAGDLETGDIDGDGDIDVLAVKHTGEWDDAGAPAELFWYENPGWQPHEIGDAPDAIKDLSLADFNNDGRLDLAALTFDEHTLNIYIQGDNGAFTQAQKITYTNLHEGMDVGDMNGDGFIDIIANGYYFENPGAPITSDWTISSIAEKWHNQEGDWSANGTKVFCCDISGDGLPEVFISHSERDGYPIAWYQYQNGTWTEHIITDTLPSCHTLQVYDMDLDGDMDVVAGINWARAINLKIDRGDVYVFLNDGSNNVWTPMLVSDQGIYNGRVADFEGDGDFDLFRLPNHEAKEVFLHKNAVRGAEGEDQFEVIHALDKIIN